MQRALEAGDARWQPLLPEGARAEALDAIDHIAAAIEALLPGERDASLAGGQAGAAVMFTWDWMARQRLAARDLASMCLDRAVEIVASETLRPFLFEGWAGVAWAAELIDGLLDPGGEDRNEALDEAVAAVLAREGAFVTPHDLVRGVTGLGVYALERLPRPAASAALRDALARLEESARHDDRGAYWWTPPMALAPEVSQQYRQGWADLGVAHGLGGAIGFLARMHAAGIERERVQRLLEEAVRWLLSQEVEAGGARTMPNCVIPDEPLRPCRLAWCYGDPGLAAVLLLAGQLVGEAAWVEQAVNLAVASTRRLPEHTGVVEASICHGTAGLGHVYNRLYHATGEPVLADAARYWFDRTLAFVGQTRSAGGDWVQGTANVNAPPWTGIGMLEGAAGIALALLAAATPVEPSWDRMLLVSAAEA